MSPAVTDTTRAPTRLHAPAVGPIGGSGLRTEVELEHVKTFGSHLRELSSIVLSNAAAARQIAAAVSQQGAGISQIFGSVTTQTRMMESTRSALDQTAKAVDVLNRVSDRVVAIVRQYRV